jgi:imidazoleglycerol-phosphate dehydratase
VARRAKVKRKTLETDIDLKLTLDGIGKRSIQTGVGFFDHLLDALCKHANIDIELEAKGDLHIDGHHTVEDVGIVLGQAFAKALEKKESITRFGFAYCPLDEALARAVIDISGRGLIKFQCDLPAAKIGDFDSPLFVEFLKAFAMNAKITLHVALIYGQNQHHAFEAMMKAFAKALKMAISIDKTQTGVPSTKGILE